MSVRFIELCQRLTAQLDVLHRAYQALKPGGTLIFDVNSMHKLEVTQKDYREEQEDEDFYFYWILTEVMFMNYLI